MPNRLYIAIHAFSDDGERILRLESAKIRKEEFDPKWVNVHEMRQIASRNLSAKKPAIGRVLGIVVNKK